MGTRIRTTCVIGTDAIGSQLAMLSALAGMKTYLMDISEHRLQLAFEELQQRLEGWVDRKKITSTEMKMAFARLHGTSDLISAAKHADLVVDAYSKDVDSRNKWISKIDQVAPSHAVILFVQSTPLPSGLSKHERRVGQICNLHLQHPPLDHDMIEVVSEPKTSERSIQIVKDWIKKLQKIPIVHHRDRFQTIAHQILHACVREACDLVENGYVTYEEVDQACSEILHHKMGPFALLDLIGLDQYCQNQDAEYARTGHVDASPHPLIKKKVGQGEWGRKTGNGFYKYDSI